MTNAKNTKRALLSSVLALFLCFTMLLGTTFAWFTDSVTSGNNKIVAGTLDIDLYKVELKDNWVDEVLAGNDIFNSVEITDSKEPIFSEDIMWEPGYTEVANLKLVNNGNLALKYQAVIRPTDTVGKLAEVIDVYVANEVITDMGGSREYQIENTMTQVGTLKEVMEGAATINGEMKNAGDTHFFAIVLKMQETAGNEYQGESAGAFDITILATQLASESDSFDDQYDRYASVGSVADMKDALAAGITEFNFMGSTVNLNYGLTKAMVPAGKTITISNAIVSGKSYGNGVDGTVIFENCTFTNTGAYSIHFDNGAGDVIFKNCTLFGWNSFGSTLNSVSFYDSFLYGNGKYALIRSYVDLYLENCTYDISNADHTDIYNEGIETVNGAKLTMVNCEQILSAATEKLVNSTAGGDIEITEDIVYNNPDPEKQLILQTENAINFNGNGKTITSQGANPSNGNHGYVAFVPPAGEDATVSDVTVTGTGFVEVGHYGIGGGEYVLNNVKIENLASTLANGDKGFTLGCAFMGMGDVTLNNCVMTGTTNVVEGAMAVDLGCGQAWTGYTDGNDNKVSTTINGGKYGTIYCWSQAIVTVNGAEIDTMYVAPINGNVTINAGTHIDTLNVNYGTSSANATRLAKLVIEDGAIIDAIVYNGTTYTVAEWNAYVASL